MYLKIENKKKRYYSEYPLYSTWPLGIHQHLHFYSNSSSLFSICAACLTEVSVVTLVTKESSGLYTVQSDLHLNVVKEDEDSFFYCEVSYLVPGGTKMTETNKINITVHCESTVPLNVSHLIWRQ